MDYKIGAAGLPIPGLIANFESSQEFWIVLMIGSMASQVKMGMLATKQATGLFLKF